MNLAWFPSFPAPSPKGQGPTGTKDSEEELLEMVQSYGIIEQSPAEPSPSSAGEQSALLGSDRDTSIKRLPDGHASIISCISNLTNTIIGSGVLSNISGEQLTDHQ